MCLRGMCSYKSLCITHVAEFWATGVSQVLEQSQVRLREAGYIPGMDFPEDENVRDGEQDVALSLFLC